MVLGDHHFMQGMSRLPSYFTLAPFEEVARTARMVGARSKGTFPDHTDLSLGNTSIHTGSNLKVYGLHFVCLVQSPIPYNCHFFYTDTIFVRIKFTPKNADFSR